MRFFACRSRIARLRGPLGVVALVFAAACGSDDPDQPRKVAGSGGGGGSSGQNGVAGSGGATTGSGGNGGGAGGNDGEGGGGGAAGSIADAGTPMSGAGGSSGAACADGDGKTEHFSFFVTSLAGMRRLADDQNGFGGDLRFGKSDGLSGADEICRRLAEDAFPGAGCKTWRAFLSVTKDASGKSTPRIASATAPGTTDAAAWSR